MDNEAYSKLDEGERHLVDWQYERGCSFFTHLMEAIARADSEQRAKLRLVYPLEVKAMDRFQNETGYWENMERFLCI